MTYGIIFWGNSVYSIHLFRLQKKIVRKITNSKKRNSCRNLYKNINIFTFISQYIFSLLSCVVTNREQYITNSHTQGRNTRYSSDIHQTISNLSLKQRGSYHMGPKVFNSLPTYKRTYPVMFRNSNIFLKKFFIQILFICWRNIFNIIMHSILYS